MLPTQIRLFRHQLTFPIPNSTSLLPPLAFWAELVATACYYVLEACLHSVWHVPPERLESALPAQVLSGLPHWNYV